MRMVLADAGALLQRLLGRGAGMGRADRDRRPFGSIVFISRCSRSRSEPPPDRRPPARGCPRRPRSAASRAGRATAARSPDARRRRRPCRRSRPRRQASMPIVVRVAGDADQPRVVLEMVDETRLFARAVDLQRPVDAPSASCRRAAPAAGAAARTGPARRSGIRSGARSSAASCLALSESGSLWRPRRRDGSCRG